ncbi:MAG: hypothetical protein HS111_23450 [Kofleriaceae bacterium]|nr:hypothetical protein [Kofleriaceae bacterium]
MRAPFRTELGCAAELAAQGARPLDASLPGATTVKTIVDRGDDLATYFQDTVAYPVHRRFAIEHLGWPAGAPFFEQYLSPGRRFVAGRGGPLRGARRRRRELLAPSTTPRRSS